MKKTVKKRAKKEPTIQEEIRRIIAIVEFTNLKMDLFLATKFGIYENTKRA